MVDSNIHSKFRQPAEWEPHAACWLAWPWDASLWQKNFETAQVEFVNLCRVISDWDERANECRGERLEVLVPDEKTERVASRALRNIDVRFHRIPVGDIWLRDTGPIFVEDRQKQILPARFGFNGWGGKYVLANDDRVAGRISEVSGLGGEASFDWILEGGSIEVDGEGTCLTSEQCLLNPNRNPGLSREQIEAKLQGALGIEKVLWVREGLLNDHTDGHIDTIARYIAPGTVMCMAAKDDTDPNARVLRQIQGELEAMTDARGRRLKVVAIPSPGRVLNDEGEIMPASYVNFYIGNRTVAVPNYGVSADEAATAAIARCFPDRRTAGLSARSVLSGGGAFHCITQQQPRGDT